MFRFTIRDVLWLTAIAAFLATLWRAHHEQSAMEAKLFRSAGQFNTLVSLIEEEGYCVEERDNWIRVYAPNGGYSGEHVLPP